MAVNLTGSNREIALAFLDSDARDAYEKYRRAKIFLKMPEKLEDEKNNLEKKYRKSLLKLQTQAYSTRDLNKFVHLPSPNSPILPRIRRVADVRADLLVFSQLCDELVARELLPEYGARAKKLGERKTV